MIDTMLQLWGASFYLLNKYFFSRAERSQSRLSENAYLYRAWLVYLAGLPAWIIVFTNEHNWIAAAIELSAAPSMVLGLISVWKGERAVSNSLNHLTRLAVLAGISSSLYEYGGLTKLSQLFELGIAAGFLMGTYSLSRRRPNGYYWLILGNLSCASLMSVEGYWILMIQQLFSLIFVVDALITSQRKQLS